MSQINVKESMSQTFKTWLYIAMAVTGVIAVVGFILGGMSDWISGLCIFLPAALICWSLWMISGGNKTGHIIMLLTSITYVVINFFANPFGFAENAVLMNVLVSVPYAAVVLPTLWCTVREKHLFKGKKES